MGWPQLYLKMHPLRRRAFYRQWVRESRRLRDPLRMTFAQFDAWVRSLAAIRTAPAGALQL